MRRRRSPPWRWLLLVLLLAVPALWRPARPLVRDPAQPVTVRRVIDGDTLVLAGGERVRLIGIDTPELARDGRSAEPGAEAARDFLRDAVEGREVTLGFDREERDQYGRHLAYVYHDGRLINEEIIRHGHSRARTSYRFHPAMKDRFRRAEREAREAGKGMWSRVDVGPETRDEE